MKLGVYERLILLNILPEQGDITTLRLVRQLRERLSFNEKEHAALKFRNDESQPGKIFWDGAAAEAMQEADIQIGPKMAALVHDLLAKLNKEKKLTEAHLSLCEKFEVSEEGDKT